MFRFVFTLVSAIGCYCQINNESNIELNPREELIPREEINVNRTVTNEPFNITKPPDPKDPLNPTSIYIYAGIGVGILILFTIQTSCLICYFKRAKLKRGNIIAGSLNENVSNDKARYYKHPTSVVKKIEPDPNVYESLAEVQRPPPPPSLDSLPRKPRTRNNPATPLIRTDSPISIQSQKSTLSSSSTKNNVKDIKTPNDIRNREPMPLPHEIPKPDNLLIQTQSLRHKPKLPSPTEPGPIATTLPSKICNKPKISVPKNNNTFNAAQDTDMKIELLEKLKKRAEMTATLDDCSAPTNHSHTLGSRKPAETKPRPQFQTPARYVQYKGGYDHRESSSDNEWTMEQLEPYNIYNI